MSKRKRILIRAGFPSPEKVAKTLGLSDNEVAKTLGIALRIEKERSRPRKNYIQSLEKDIAKFKHKQPAHIKTKKKTK